MVSLADKMSPFLQGNASHNGNQNLLLADKFEYPRHLSNNHIFTCPQTKCKIL